MTQKEIDPLSGVETTGHEWDGIKELNTPLPRWWLWTFFGCILFAIGYVIAYPAIPWFGGATKGVLGYSSRAEFAKSMEVATAAQSGMRDQIAASSVDQIIADPEMARFAQAGGASLFKVNCEQCHGSGAQGAPGFPNLNDDEWIWGGTPEAIYATISHGVRYAGDDQTHENEMPVFGDGILTADEIRSVAGYAASLSGMKSDLPVTEAGKTLFADNCVACHGEGGVGNAELGAPPLNNAIWLYAKSPEGIIAQITKPQHGVMPAWRAKLGDVAVKELAVYVYGLGGGQ